MCDFREEECSELAEHYIEPYVGTYHFESLSSKLAGDFVSRLLFISLP